LAVADLSGRKVNLSWASDKRPTLVYVFTPSCPWCKRNLPNITALSAARQSDYRFIGLSLSTSGLQEYVAANHIAFPVYSYPFANEQKLFSVGGTPATLLVSPDGSLRQLWLGAYSGDTQKKVEEVFRLKLPGIVS
jgi:AhpC/TSA family